MTPNTVPAAPKRCRTYEPALDPAKPPARVDRKMLAYLLFILLGLRVSPRTIEGWPLETKLVNGRATHDTAAGLAYGRAMLDAAPAVRGGRKRAADLPTAA